MALLECKNICLGYDGEEILHNICFSVSKGDYLCIVGENGSGKTTLMKTILGLKKPISGKIFFGDGLRQNEVGYLPQQTAVQKDFPATCEEVVMSGFAGSHRSGILKNGLFYSKEQRERGNNIMTRLGIVDLAKRSYRSLSGGQQQKVLLCRALCATGKMLLLDEPVSGLDSATKTEMYRILEKLREDGVSIIMVTHDTGEVLPFATHFLQVSGDRVFFMTQNSYSQRYAARTVNKNEPCADQPQYDKFDPCPCASDSYSTGTDAEVCDSAYPCAPSDGNENRRPEYSDYCQYCHHRIGRPDSNAGRKTNGGRS